MATAPETPRLERTIGGVLGWLAVLLLAPVVLLVAIAVVFAAGSFAYTQLIPVHAADHYVSQIQTNVRLRFFWLWDLGGDPNDSGRYLTIANRVGSKTFNMCGFDWAHFSRTSLYLTEDNNLAVIGPHECDYVVDVNALKLRGAWRSTASEKWTYLGAFQIASEGRLRFIDASEQPECIEMLRSSSPPEATRESARRDRCPPPSSQ